MKNCGWYLSPKGLREKAAEFDAIAMITASPSMSDNWRHKAGVLRGRAKIIEHGQ